MNKYVIVSLIYAEAILPEMHDIEIDNFQKQSKKAIREAKKKGVQLFFKESINDRIVSESFALVEYNFDMPRENQELLVKFINKFFNDASTGTYLNIKETLKAVRFLKTTGELITITKEG